MDRDIEKKKEKEAKLAEAIEKELDAMKNAQKFKAKDIPKSSKESKLKEMGEQDTIKR